MFAGSAPSRGETDRITRQIIESGVDIILSGGEILLLPAGRIGRFGHPGLRQDSVDMIERAKELGYTVVYSRRELLDLPDETPKVLGVFGPVHTFNDRSEEDLVQNNLTAFPPGPPSLADMTAKALDMLEARGERFLLVVEEEGSDNMANQNNAAGTLEALSRADAALAEALEYVEEHPETLVITAADSDAGGLEVWPVRKPAAFEQPLPFTTSNGAPLDGRTGSGGLPFVAEPDARGERLRFGIAWAGGGDMLGGIVAVSVDNTDIYRMLYATLFGEWLD